MASYNFYFHRSTPAGEGGIALVELYGEHAGDVCAEVFRPRRGRLPALQEARLGDLLDAAAEPLDEVLAAHLPAASSWSQLETWSLELHGGAWLQEKLLRQLEALGGKSLDTRGVLLLAFAAGALDAIQASAYELLVQSTTLRAARFFLRQHRGELSDTLKRLLSLVEAGDRDEVGRCLDRLVAHSTSAYRLAHPLRLLVAGRANAGKSTLFNALVEDERAVVTAVPGTTRDQLEELITIDDYPVLLSDSAGVRPLEEADAVEKEGIRRSWRKAASEFCDGVLYLIEPPWQPTAEDLDFTNAAGPGRCLVVATKEDKATGEREPVATEFGRQPGWNADCGVSAQIPAGLGELRRCIVKRWIEPLGSGFEDAPGAPFTCLQGTFIATARQALGQGNLDGVRQALIQCLHSWH